MELDASGSAPCLFVFRVRAIRSCDPWSVRPSRRDPRSSIDGERNRNIA